MWSSRKRSLQLVQSTSGSVKFSRWPLRLPHRGRRRGSMRRSARRRPAAGPSALIHASFTLRSMSDAERAVVVAGTEPAVDLGRWVDEPTALAEVDDLVEVGRRHSPHRVRAVLRRATVGSLLRRGPGQPVVSRASRLRWRLRAKLRMAQPNAQTLTGDGRTGSPNSCVCASSCAMRNPTHKRCLDARTARRRSGPGRQRRRRTRVRVRVRVSGVRTWRRSAGDAPASSRGRRSRGGRPRRSRSTVVRGARRSSRRRGSSG